MTAEEIVARQMRMWAEHNPDVNVRCVSDECWMGMAAAAVRTMRELRADD